jgi:STE24 endopeptidase
VPVRLRLPIAIVAALVVAEAAVVIMRPRGLVEPLDVASRAYFSAAQIEKAEAYRTGQLWLFGARMVIELGVLALHRRPSRRASCCGRAGARSWPVRRPPRRCRSR